MKSILLTLAALFSFTGLTAQATEVGEIRSEIQQLVENLDQLTGFCDQVKAKTEGVSAQIKGLIGAVQSSTVTTQENSQAAVTYLSQALNQSKFVVNDCKNTPGFNPSKILIEMYLSHADTELMLYQYGVGPNGYKK